jgi:hypothetical protein
MTLIAKKSGYYASTPKPTAFITKGKQRVKQYSQTVYLKDGDEFEIELFNPTQKTILAKIKINGEYVSTSGLILRPGQRVFLERFIDADKKMVYSIYEVNGNNNEVLEAIKLNGNVEIEFYNETLWNTTSTGTALYNGYPHTLTLYNSNPYWNSLPISGLVNNNTNIIGTTLSNTTTNTSYFTNSVHTSNTSIETGRVESGQKSNQNFVTVSNINFEWFPFSKVEWKILPQSQKPVEVSDLKKYCYGCGSKIKKSTYKFCPNCGTKLD